MKTKVVLAPKEDIQMQSLVATRRPDDTFFGTYLATMTSKRVFAEDANGTLLFNFYLKDIARAEVRESFWKGDGIRLLLQDGNDFVFKLMKDGIYEDADAARRWVNTINQVLLIWRNQTPAR
ncbi:hypothetical protein D7Y27_11510 [Corallococcus sp. AB004]|uniref:hypothetical protein n=1 Tax=Corallococcus TaxID=83461 RepID=UPI000EA3E4FC|nr:MULTISPECIES: hypothetical protein [Corallococcus]RKI45018.1 hypothetical protein D7Y27_11510 [Corallococcus sp. AB004]NPC70319.1 hypothetical protein [Corallococcus exiguus]NPD22270.1 hypothetical protein [Corallococcus exiguus]NRD44421.1 hypothetical protein [Corallococcus exiguus]RKI04612.1 hypothetical protein D7Y04_06745 [Corallococcus sp. AB038B]